MKTTIINLLLVAGVFSCSAQTNEKIYGPFAPNNMIKTLPVDYTKTYVYKYIAQDNQLKPPYRYLDSIELFSIGTFSDSLFLDGFLVSPKQAGVFPVIIYCRSGNAQTEPIKIAEALQIMAAIASRGYVVVGMNYRGVKGCGGHDDFGASDARDILNLVSHLHEIEKADTSRLGIFGHSRGGMSTYTTMAKTCVFKAAVVSGGIADAESEYASPQYPLKELYQKLIPDFEKNKTAELKKRSVVCWADQLCKSTPLLILHGTKDQNANVSGAEKLAAELDKTAFPYCLIKYDDNHGLENHRPQALSELVNWFDRYLKKK